MTLIVCFEALPSCQRHRCESFDETGILVKMAKSARGSKRKSNEPSNDDAANEEEVSLTAGSTPAAITSSDSIAMHSTDVTLVRK
jgi:hypothetical protein